MKNKQAITGFTLLEVLLAIFIFSVVVSTVFGSYFLVFQQVEAIDQDMTYHEMAQNCLLRMKTDMQSVHIPLPPGYDPPKFGQKPGPYQIVGDSVFLEGLSFSRLIFSSYAHLPINGTSQKQIVQIAYYVQALENEGLVLKRSDNFDNKRDFEEKDSDPILCRSIKGLMFKYFDHDNQKYETWDSESREFRYATPCAIGIQLEVGDDSQTHMFATLVTLPVHRKKLK